MDGSQVGSCVLRTLEVLVVMADFTAIEAFDLLGFSAIAGIMPHLEEIVSFDSLY
jgi:hypothetical protein